MSPDYFVTYLPDRSVVTSGGPPGHYSRTLNESMI